MKILIAGGFGAGKTTLVGKVSEIQLWSTEETLTAASIGTDDLEGTPDKSTTTVALDFGRRTIPGRSPLVLYLFGMPGQERFWFLWDELATGALGAVILVDTRRLHACFSAIDFFERRRVPFVIAVNTFDDAYRYDVEEVRAALELQRQIPIVHCDPRDHPSAVTALITLLDYRLGGSAAQQPHPAPQLRA